MRQARGWPYGHSRGAAVVDGRVRRRRDSAIARPRRRDSAIAPSHRPAVSRRRVAPPPPSPAPASVAPASVTPASVTPASVTPPTPSPPGASAAPRHVEPILRWKALFEPKPSVTEGVSTWGCNYGFGGPPPLSRKVPPKKDSPTLCHGKCELSPYFRFWINISTLRVVDDSDDTNPHVLVLKSSQNFLICRLPSAIYINPKYL